MNAIDPRRSPEALRDRRHHGALRRGIDVAGAATGLVLAAPVMAVLAIAILLVLGRPVLFFQDRVGVGKRRFRLVKFRTMTNATDERGVLLPDSRRTGRLGRFLRRSRFDELPELWNILIGEMSFIGPRPLLPGTIEAMGAGGERRCDVPPGLTGWAQVSGNAILTDGDKLSLDLWYIEHRSLRIDLLIVTGTIKLVLLGDKVNKRRIELSRIKR